MISTSPSTPPTRNEPARRSKSSSAGRAAAVVGLALIGAGIGLWSNAAPTGSATLDTVYRALFGALVVLAAAKARRRTIAWTAAVLAGASGVVAATGGSSVTPFGVGAGVLFIAALGWWRWGHRDRVVGAQFGVAAVGLATHVPSVAPQGTAAGLVAIAILPLLLSGRRYARRSVRRLTALTAVVIVVALVASVAATGLVGWRSTDELRAGAEAVRDGARAVRNTDRETAVGRFAAAARDLGAVSDQLHRPWVQASQAVPVLAQNVRAVQGLAERGAELADQAAASADSVDYEQIRRDGGGVNLAVLESFGPVVRRAARALHRAHRLAVDVDSPWLAAPLRSALGEFDAKITDLLEQTDLASLAIDRAPALLGGDGPRTYVVLLVAADDASSAPVQSDGATVISWVELTADDGSLHLQTVAASGGSVTSAVPSVAAGQFTASTGVSPDGIIAADAATFARLLDVTGPVRVPALGRSIGRADAEALLRSVADGDVAGVAGQIQGVTSRTTVQTIVDQFVRDVFEQFTSSKLPAPARLAELFHGSVADRRLRFESFDEADRPLLERLGLM